MEFDAVIDKTEKGFGIYFAKVAASDGGSHGLVVDGFVEGPEGVGDGQDAPNKEALASLRLGDLLVRVNGEDCQGKETADVLGLLRAASVGRNTLSFLRRAHEDTELHDNSAAKAQKRGLIGALLKVKSKIRAEIDGDEDQLLREQLEDERFEKQWLEEFEVLKKQYEAKWETCTYTADEFCGLLYRSGDAQQKESLLQQYPTLMEAWKDARASSSGSSRVIPEWPAAKLAYDNSVLYDPVGRTDSSSSSTPASANPRSIRCSRSLQKALECLRTQFMWRSDDLRAFSRRLDADSISSCSTLLEALHDRSAYFERNFQSKEYPRLSKTMLRALLENAEKEIASTSSLPPLDLSQHGTASA